MSAGAGIGRAQGHRFYHQGTCPPLVFRDNRRVAAACAGLVTVGADSGVPKVNAGR
jgi:hypothetical protein